RADPPDPARELGDLRPHAGLGQHPQAERQRGRADVVALLDLQRQGDGREVILAELPVPAGPPGTSRRSTSRPSAGLLSTGPRPGRLRPAPPGPGPSIPGPPIPGPSTTGPSSTGQACGPGRGRDAAAAAGGRWLADGWQQPEQVAVAEHPRRGAEPLSGLRD